MYVGTTSAGSISGAPVIGPAPRADDGLALKYGTASTSSLARFAFASPQLALLPLVLQFALILFPPQLALFPLPP